MNNKKAPTGRLRLFVKGVNYNGRKIFAAKPLARF